MKKEERIAALKALAIKHLFIDPVGHLWKNPLNPRSTGIRWTQSALDFFKQEQRQYQLQYYNTLGL